ncbi:MAG: alpha-galactosidase, partial [Hymenobacter sp.]
MSQTQPTTIPITTDNTALVLQTDASNRLNTVYFGLPLAAAADYAGVAAQHNFNDANAGFYPNAYTPAGTWNLAEPAIQVTHADGNQSLELHYVRHETKPVDAHSKLTRILLRDPKYAFDVTLCYQVWPQENVIEQWTELQHHEKKAVTLHKYASANLYFTQKDFYLTTFQGQYLKEAQPAQTKLLQGMRSVESKLGTRAMLLQTPNFILGLGQPAAENEGTVLVGQLAWSGNF